jgi:hypothetical protein
VKSNLSKRCFLLKDLYQFYTRENPKHRKSANIDRYKIWLKEKCLQHSNDNALKFKKTKYFIKVIDERSFAIRLSHVKTDELGEVIGLAKEKRDKQESIGGWLFSTKVYTRTI